MDWSHPDPINLYHLDRAQTNWRNRAAAPRTPEDNDIILGRLFNKHYYVEIGDMRDAVIMRVLTRLAQKGIKPVARPLASHLGH